VAELTPPVTADSEVDQLPEPALVLNADGVVTHWNTEAAGLTGVDAATAVGTHAQEFADVDDGEELVTATALREGRSVRETEGRSVRETEGRSGQRPTGDQWHTHDVAGLLYDHEGNIADSFEADTEEIAAMVDEIVTQAERVTTRTDDLATANQQQTGIETEISTLTRN